MASSSYERRNARARAEGYRNDYDRRVHDHGRIAPGVPVTPEMREQARGHRSLADLERLLDRYAGRDIHVIPAGLDRDPSTGRWRTVDVLVLMPDGSERRFVLRGRQASTQALTDLKSSLGAAGVPFLAAPSIDVFADADEPDVEDFDEVA